jgi:hypothetical protein
MNPFLHAKEGLRGAFVNLDIPLRHHRYAGARRVRFGKDLAHHLAILGKQEWSQASERGFLPEIAGESQRVLFVTTNPSAFTTAQVTYIGPLTGIQQSPLVLCLHYIPSLTITAAKTATIQMRRTDTPAVISNAVILAGTTQTTIGAITLVGYLPMPSTTTTAVQIPAGSGIDVQGADTNPGAQVNASATAPVTLGAFGIA